MKKYLLDTHIIAWFLTENKRLNENIEYNIRYFQSDFYVSIEALHEIITLQEVKKDKFELASGIEQIAQLLKNHNIKILPIEIRHLKTLEKLSVPTINGKEHHDPSDRIMIAQAISEKMILVSNDEKFPFYKDRGFNLLENV